MRLYSLKCVLVTLLFCTTRLITSAESQSGQFADAKDVRLHRAIVSSAEFADPQQQSASDHNNSFVAHAYAGASDLQLQRLCTNGVSTYASSRRQEAALSKHPTPGKHKDLWPLNSRDWWAFGFSAVAIFVAAGGGIGGGGVLVPLFTSVLGQFQACCKHFPLVLMCLYCQDCADPYSWSFPVSSLFVSNKHTTGHVFQVSQQSMLLPFPTSLLWAVHVPTCSSTLAGGIPLRGSL